MDKEISSISPEIEKIGIIKDSVLNNFGQIITNLSQKDINLPQCCENASNLFRNKIKEETGINVKICKGVRYDEPNFSLCYYHVWLEYEDLIIDTTDFQFYVDENFSKLVNEVRLFQTSTETFTNKLKQDYKCKIFYSKFDQQCRYRQY